MAKIGKLTCDCGEIYKEKKVGFRGYKVDAMVCPRCNDEIFTMQQAKKLEKLIKMHNLLDKERKIVKIGNSLGITLPESLKEFGIEVGRKVRVIAVSPNTLKIVII